jgi:hypothetical protein
VEGSVPAAELRRRALEGLQVLAALMDAPTARAVGGLYDLVTELEPAQARIAVFAAAVVAREQQHVSNVPFF